MSRKGPLDATVLVRFDYYISIYTVFIQYSIFIQRCQVQVGSRLNVALASLLYLPPFRVFSVFSTRCHQRTKEDFFHFHACETSPPRKRPLIWIRRPTRSKRRSKTRGLRGDRNCQSISCNTCERSCILYLRVKGVHWCPVLRWFTRDEGLGKKGGRDICCSRSQKNCQPATAENSKQALGPNSDVHFFPGRQSGLSEGIFVFCFYLGCAVDVDVDV